VRVTLAPTAGPALTAAAEGAALLWLESPSNPGLDACDIAALAEAAHRGGGLVAVDKSLATPLGQRPLDLGADLSVASDTKARTGHSDLILGHVAARDPALVARLPANGACTGEPSRGPRRSGSTTARSRPRRAAGATGRQRPRHRRRRARPARPRRGALPGPARRPRARPGGAPDAPFRRGPALDLGHEPAADRFVGGLRLVVHAASCGGVQSSAERRARWGGADCPPGLVRLAPASRTPTTWSPTSRQRSIGPRRVPDR
jgi:cystathionine gamma-lyase